MTLADENARIVRELFEAAVLAARKWHGLSGLGAQDVPTLTHHRREYLGASMLYFVITDARHGMTPVSATLDHTLVPLLDEDGGTAFNDLLELLERVVTMLPPVPHHVFIDNRLWPQFLQLVEATRDGDNETEMRMVEHLTTLPEAGETAIGTLLTTMPNAEWWLTRAANYLEFGNAIPAGARV